MPRKLMRNALYIIVIGKRAFLKPLESVSFGQLENWVRSFRFVAFGLIAGVTCHVASADQVSEFEKVIRTNSEATTEATPVYFNKYTNQWAKRRFLLTNVKYDVKRTDSLVNPIVGLVSFSLDIEQTALVPTKEDAERATVFLASRSVYKIFLTYAYKNESWILKDGEFEDPYLQGKRYTITSTKIAAEPDAIPFAALKYWLH